MSQFSVCKRRFSNVPEVDKVNLIDSKKYIASLISTTSQLKCLKNVKILRLQNYCNSCAVFAPQSFHTAGILNPLPNEYEGFHQLILIYLLFMHFPQFIFTDRLFILIQQTSLLSFPWQFVFILFGYISISWFPSIECKFRNIQIKAVLNFLHYLEGQEKRLVILPFITMLTKLQLDQYFSMSSIAYMY